MLKPECEDGNLNLVYSVKMFRLGKQFSVSIPWWHAKEDLCYLFQVLCNFYGAKIVIISSTDAGGKANK